MSTHFLIVLGQNALRLVLFDFALYNKRFKETANINCRELTLEFSDDLVLCTQICINLTQFSGEGIPEQVIFEENCTKKWKDQ